MDIDELVRALRDAEGNNELDCEINELRPLLLKAAALIESLQTQLSASQRREKAAVEDIRQACGNCAHSGNPSCPWEGTYHHRGPSGEKIGVCNAWEWRGTQKKGAQHERD